MGGGGGGMGAEGGGALGVFDGLTVVPATCKKITSDTSHACMSVGKLVLRREHVLDCFRSNLGKLRYILKPIK